MSDDIFSKILENRFTRPIKRKIVKSIASRNGSRALLNRYYELLDDNAKSRFQARYAKIFREHNVHLDAGSWCVRFIDHTIKLPLRPQYAWLDWDNAVSILGHDIEIKKTYTALIQSKECPTMFMDVGANYGMHSILFLSAGIPTISFEPNESCRPCFEAVCELNGISGRWEEVAVGDQCGNAELAYLEMDTWLGSLAPEVVSNLQKRGHVLMRNVRLRRLDEYLGDIPRERVLIKIDVEGAELDVLRGASQMLEVCKPKIIFESSNFRQRRDLYLLLERYGYSVHVLPWLPSVAMKCQTIDEFVVSSTQNFIAI